VILLCLSLLPLTRVLFFNFFGNLDDMPLVGAQVLDNGVCVGECWQEKAQIVDPLSFHSGAWSTVTIWCVFVPRRGMNILPR